MAGNKKPSGTVFNALSAARRVTAMDGGQQKTVGNGI